MQIPYGLCQCGCGQTTKIATSSNKRYLRVKGKSLRFINGHNRRIVIDQTALPNPTGFCRCGCGAMTMIAKRTDHHRHRIAGEPLRYLPGHQHFQPWPQRFWSHVKIGNTNECWLWQGNKTTTGHGHIRIGKKMVYVHRISYELERGPIPPSLYVLHTCDTPNCVNPAHLYVGSMQDNVRDMINRGRSPNRKGEHHSQAKLQPEQVLAIRDAYTSHTANGHQLAQQYGVAQTTISAIIRRRLWKHI